jgi:hypothetical protein
MMFLENSREMAPKRIWSYFSLLYSSLTKKLGNQNKISK